MEGKRFLIEKKMLIEKLSIYMDSSPKTIGIIGDLLFAQFHRLQVAVIVRSE